MLHVVIDTPRVAAKVRTKSTAVQVERRAVCGRLFPYDFGFVPSTLPTTVTQTYWS